MTVRRSEERLEPGTDVAALAEGFATVTALRPPADAGAFTLPRQRTRS